MTTNQPISLKIDNLQKEFPTPTQPLAVLRGVSLDMQDGRSLAIVGPSGSGKSTLLNVIGTLEEPSAGRVLLDGTDPFALSPAQQAAYRASTIGFVFQDHHLLPQLNALENVLVAKLAQHRADGVDVQRARGLLDQVGLSARQSHRPAELSGGERQRVAIARALMNEPRLLLCDEPTGNLDSKNAQSIGQLLLSVARAGGATLIVVTHNPELAMQFDRQMRMEDGLLLDAP